MNKTTLLVALLLPFFAGAAHSAEKAVPREDVSARIKSTLQERFPNVTIEKVAPSAWPGLYEVIGGNEIAYTNADGSLLFAGKVLDTKTKQDLTAKRWGELNAIEFDKLPFDLAIKTVKGDGSRLLAVFSDPDCPYCQQLEQDMKDVTDVTIYTFLYPLESLHPESRQKAVKIWCAQDRAGAWSGWMLKKSLPQQETACDGDPIAQLLKLGETLKIESTPTLFFADGVRNSGALSRELLEQALSVAKPAGQTAAR